MQAKIYLAAVIAILMFSCADASVTTSGGEGDTDADGDSDADSDSDSDSDGDGFCADDPCDSNATCTSTDTGYLCECNDGFAGDGESCEDIDECLDGTDECDDDHGSCTNTEGGYNCDCEAGWQLDGMLCEDIDECEDETDTCDENATCTNNDGSYECDCNDNYEGDGETCTELPPEVIIDITPGTGSITSDGPFWDTKGYRVVPGVELDLLALEWMINMPSSGTLSARLYSSGGALLASGATVSGDGTEQWYRSDITYTLAVGQTYYLVMYNTAAATSIFQYKDDPSQPFTVTGYFTNVRSMSEGGDTFPISENSWAPYMRVVAQP